MYIKGNWSGRNSDTSTSIGRFTACSVHLKMTARLLVIVVCLASLSCGDSTEKPAKRTYRMGFANSAPRFDDFNLFLQSLNLWTTRADAAIVNTEVPWDSLLSGVPAVDYVQRNYVGLVDFYRTRNLKVWVYIDPQNGLDRAADATALQLRGKSIADEDMQEVYRRFVIVMDSLLNPDHLGLALETNLVRAASPASIYLGVKQAANDVASELKARGRTVPLSVSVQVDVAWGTLGGGGYTGIDQDFADFPFIEEVGLSSYPYFGIETPDQVPPNYYSRLVEGRNIPVFVSEGGWSSGSVSTTTTSFISSEEEQAAYIRRHPVLLDEVNAIAWFQLPFTDIDISSVPPPVPDNLGYFIYLGLVDLNLAPKQALADWDEIFRRERKSN